jgi:glycosyltransferase involved in cell wall biosynthesis
VRPLLLSVLPRPPHPTRDGLAIRNYQLLAALAREFRVRAFSLRDPSREYGGGEVPEGVEIEWVAQARRGWRRAMAAATSLPGGPPYSERLYRSAVLARRLTEETARDRPTWVVAHSYHVAPAALSSGGPVWIDFHNLDSEIWERTGRTASSGPERLFSRIQAPRVRRLEGRLAAEATGLSCVSERDARVLRGAGAAVEPLVVPNGVDLSRYRFRTDAPEREVVFFVGDLSWPPNAEAVRWFGREIWPIIRKRRPRAVAEILGRGAPRDVARLGAADFVLAGEGDDTRPHWARAAVAVVPLLAGGGTRLKILEAAACGVPVVSTSVGAEGIGLAPEKDIRVRDGAEEFAAAVAQLLGDPAASGRQAVAARARVEASYDWEGIGRAFAAELARRSGGGGRS